MPKPARHKRMERGGWLSAPRFYPACNAYAAWIEYAQGDEKVTCKNCRRILAARKKARRV